MSSNHNATLKSVTERNLELPSQFQPGEACLVNIGGIHLHGEIRSVSFGDDGKVRYTCWIGDNHGVVEATVPSERCARGMEGMMYYGPAAPGETAPCDAHGVLLR